MKSTELIVFPKFKNIQIRKLEHSNDYEVVAFPENQNSSSVIIAFIQKKLSSLYEIKSQGMNLISYWEDGLDKYIDRCMELIYIMEEYG